MKKTIFTSFIKKYYLDSSVESVKVESNDNNLVVKFMTEDNMVTGAVLMKDANLQKAVVGINNTSDLLKLLNAHSDDITINFNELDGKIRSIKLKDEDIESTFIVADPDIIMNRPGVPKNQPEYEIDMTPTKEFVDKYLTACNALSTNNVGIQAKGDVIEFIMGYSQNNTNRITIKNKLNKPFESEVINFNSDILKKIFSNNKDFNPDSVGMLLSTKGLMKMRFGGDQLISEYYIVKIMTN